MSLPIRPVIRPADLEGQKNGRLDPSLLRTVSPVADRGWSMHHLAARAYEALRAAAWADGIQLSLSGNPYRDYAGQEKMFRSRYRPGLPTSMDRKGRVWQGQRWYRFQGAPSAVPGTSNHGWGLAADFAIDTDGDIDYEWPVRSVDTKTVNWLVANAHRFGFSAEMQVEPWHWRYVAGDRVPQAVLDFEANLNAPVVPVPNPLAEVAAAIDAARKHVLRRGSGSGSKAEQDAVWWLQTLLTAKGYVLGKPDGRFGPRTEQAVRAFQRAHGLLVDGVVGPKTWARLVA